MLFGPPSRVQGDRKIGQYRSVIFAARPSPCLCDATISAGATGVRMEAYLVEWANLLVRWLHLIAGIAWIGASFHFIGLDLTLEPPKEERDRAKGVMGEQWAVHGGGFYHKQKYLLATPA